MNKSSTWTDITSYNLPFSFFLKKIQESELLIFRLHLLTKYLVNSSIHNSAASTFPYIDFPSNIKYYSINTFIMINKYMMPSGHSM